MIGEALVPGLVFVCTACFSEASTKGFANLARSTILPTNFQSLTVALELKKKNLTTAMVPTQA